MEASAMVGLIIGIIILVIIIIALLVCGVWLWKRRDKRVLKRRTTMRPASSMTTVSGNIVDSKHDYRLSRDPLSSPAGDLNGSVNELTGQNPDGALAPPPPIGVVAPPRLPV